MKSWALPWNAARMTFQGAGGAGSIRKITTTRNGKTYTYWQGLGLRPRHGQADPAQHHRKNAEGSGAKAEAGNAGYRQRRVSCAVQADIGTMAGDMVKDLLGRREAQNGTHL